MRHITAHYCKFLHAPDVAPYNQHPGWALVGVDLQKIFAVRDEWDEGCIKSAAKLISYGRSEGVPIIYLRTLGDAKSMDVPAIDERYSLDFIDSVKPRIGDTVVSKKYSNGFFRTRLYDELRLIGAKYLVMFGGNADKCLKDTLYAATQEHRYKVVILINAVLHNEVNAKSWITPEDYYRRILRILNGYSGILTDLDDVFNVIP